MYVERTVHRQYSLPQDQFLAASLTYPRLSFSICQIEKGLQPFPTPHPNIDTPSLDLPHMSEDRLIDVKSFEFLETKECNKYPVLIMMIISRTRKI